MQVFGSSGTRGVANEELTPAFVLRVAKAAGTTWGGGRGGDRVAIARDTRHTGRMLADAAASGLASTGTDVDRLGIVPTPGAQAYAEREGVPVMVITASHNPPPYSGVKLVGSDGVELSISALEDIEETLLAESFTVASWDETGRVRDIDEVKREYVDGLLAATDREVIADADLTVALDPGHGAGSLTSPEFFRELGCRVVTVNAQPDGHFPGRDPNRFRTTSRTSVGSSGRPTPTSASPTTATPTARFSSTRTATTSRATPRSPRSPPPNSRPATPPSPRSTSPSDSSTWSPRSGPNSS